VPWLLYYFINANSLNICGKATLRRKDPTCQLCYIFLLEIYQEMFKRHADSAASVTQMSSSCVWPWLPTMWRMDWEIVDYLRIRSAQQLYLYWLLVLWFTFFLCVSLRGEHRNDKGKKWDISNFLEEKCLISIIKPSWREYFGNIDVNMKIILK
jgi:hypothetical protein